MTDLELEALLADLESDRVERKPSVSDRDRIREAICAFANDLPNHQAPGVLFVGARDDGSCPGLPITDELLRGLADMRSDGNIVPIPSMTVQKKTVHGCVLAVIVVEPSDAPPVRLRGRVWIRVGPRRALATPEQERRLSERSRSRDIPFDLRVSAAEIGDLDLDLFQRTYLPASVAPDILEVNRRSLEQQLASLRMTTGSRPTVVGVLVLGKDPSGFIPGAYVQFLRIDGTELTEAVGDSATFGGPLSELIRGLEEKLEAHIETAREFRSSPIEVAQPDYPFAALQQLIRNVRLPPEVRQTVKTLFAVR